MSRVHDAMRRLERENPPPASSGAVRSNLVGALLGELANEVPSDPHLETVRTDLLNASHSFATGKKSDVAVRFYLAIRSLLHENGVLKERLKKAESAMMNQVAELGNADHTGGPPIDFLAIE
jgi:hypothetical protein